MFQVLLCLKQFTSLLSPFQNAQRVHEKTKITGNCFVQSDPINYSVSLELPFEKAHLCSFFNDDFCVLYKKSFLAACLWDRELAVGRVRKGARTGSLEAQMCRMVPFPAHCWLLCSPSRCPLEAVTMHPQQMCMGLPENCLPSTDEFNICKKNSAKAK